MATKTLLYNLSKPVGKSCANCGDDVLLVRFSCDVSARRPT